MTRRRSAAVLLVAHAAFAVTVAAQSPTAVEPPKAKVVPHRLEQHGQARIDNTAGSRSARTRR
jgi:hypothetical protein